MAAVSTSRRALAGIILIIAGVLYALAVLLPAIGVTALSFLSALAYLAIAIALVVLALGAVNSTVAKIVLFAGAVGWFLLALTALPIGLPAGVVTVAAILAALGTLVGAIVLYVGKEITNTAALAFIITAILAVIVLLPVLGVFSLGGAAIVVAVLFAVGLIITGVLFRRPERGSRR